MTRRLAGFDLTLKHDVATNAVTFPALALALVVSALDIPPAPVGEEYTWDGAHLLGFGDEAKLHSLQLDALNRFNSPIVVVTIGSTQDYGEKSIETLARRWFDTWKIGTLGLERGANQGILVLVASRDRRARIELGADWGHTWDSHAKKIMDQQMVPRFKQGDYPGGIVAGTEALLEMAKGGPSSAPPGDFLERAGSRMNGYSLLDPKPFLAVMGIGVLLVLLGIFGPESSRKLLIISGLVLILGAAFTYIALIIVLVIVSLFRRGRGGYSGSGRGYSGGYSGGGGASGSW